MDSSAGSWTAGQVARHLGIAESTLRSWHRRYDIGPQGSEPGRYRRYSEADVARLRQMLDLIKLGMLASEAARAVQTSEPAAVSAERDVADLVAAARAADPERCRIVLDNVLVRRGVVEAWEAVCRPALVLVDADQRDDPECMDIEHALSWAMLAALHRVPSPPIAPGTPLILLACVEAEHHTLPLAALAAALGAHRIPVRMLGAATPTSSLVRAVRETAPAAVVLWSQRPDTAGRHILQLLSSYPVTVFTAGPGWPPPGRGRPASSLNGAAALAPPAEGVEHLTDLPAALAALAALTGHAAGGPVAGGPVAGGQVAGGQVAGGQVAGGPAAGDPAAGDPTANGRSAARPGPAPPPRDAALPPARPYDPRQTRSRRQAGRSQPPQAPQSQQSPESQQPRQHQETPGQRPPARHPPFPSGVPWSLQ